MPHLDQVKDILSATLGLGQLRLDVSTALLGNLPELDSMSVAELITALEQHFGFAVADDEINAQHFATVGSLHQFVLTKLA